MVTATPSISYAQNSKNKLPDIGISGYSVLSVDKERQIGLAMMRQLRASQPLIQDPVLIEYINQLGNKLVKNADNVSYPFEFFLVNNNELNAFACACKDGYHYVNGICKYNCAGANGDSVILVN